MKTTIHPRLAVTGVVVLALTACSSAQMRSAAEARAAWDAARAASSAPSQMPQVSQTAQVSPTAPSRGGSQPYATTVLAKLPVKGRAPKTGYAESLFPWSDARALAIDGSGNGCTTRDDILRRDLRPYTIKPGTRGCTPQTGVLADTYTGNLIQFVREPGRWDDVQIDHVVARSEAWQKGAQAWTPERRKQFANDPLNLLAVDGPTNGRKHDGDAATWLPRPAYRCAYVARQVSVKARYGLWVTAAERDAMKAVLGTCPKQRIPSAAATRVPAPKAVR